MVGKRPRPSMSLSRRTGDQRQRERTETKHASADPRASFQHQSIPNVAYASESQYARREGGTLPPLSALAAFSEQSQDRPAGPVPISHRHQEFRQQRPSYHAQQNPASSSEPTLRQGAESPRHVWREPVNTPREGMRAEYFARHYPVEDTRQVQGTRRSYVAGSEAQEPVHSYRHAPGYVSQSDLSPQRLTPRPSLAIPPRANKAASTSPSTSYSPQTESATQPFPLGVTPASSTGYAAEEGFPSSVSRTLLSAGAATEQGRGVAHQSPAGTQYMTVETAQGPLSIPLDLQGASRVADEKRRRNAGASARFRARRKEKEQANSKDIEEMKQRINDLSEDVEFYRNERDLLASALNGTRVGEQLFPRPISPRRRRPAQHISHSHPSSAQESQSDSSRRQSPPSFLEQGAPGPQGRNTRRRVGEEQATSSPEGEPSRTTKHQAPTYSLPTQTRPAYATDPQSGTHGSPSLPDPAYVSSSGRGTEMYSTQASPSPTTARGYSFAPQTNSGGRPAQNYGRR